MGDCEECTEELQQQRACSPGTVGDEENLARLFYIATTSHRMASSRLLPFLFGTSWSNTEVVCHLRD